MPILASVLFSNMPQGVLSLFYLLLNGILTGMVSNAEWASYARKRKPTRTTKPEGEQRSTLWLQLPYRYSATFLVTMATLHWAVSQAFFFVQYQIYSHGVEIPSQGFSAAKLSTGGLLITTIILSIVSLVILGLGLFKKYPADLPLLGGCIMIIAAACHRPVDDEGAELKPVRWGVVSTDEDGVGHCCFTSKEVTMPVDGQLYA